MEEDLPLKISRNVCLQILSEAIKVFTSIDNIHEVHGAFSKILHSHGVLDQEWFQACAESYVLDSETGDNEMQVAIDSVMDRVQILQASGEYIAGEDPTFVCAPFSHADAEDNDGREESVHIEDTVNPKEVLAGNLRKLSLIQGILSGEIVTERQRRRREERAKARLTRTEARAMRMKERAKRANDDVFKMEKLAASMED